MWESKENVCAYMCGKSNEERKKMWVRKKKERRMSVSQEKRRKWKSECERVMNRDRERKRERKNTMSMHFPKTSRLKGKLNLYIYVYIHRVNFERVFCRSRSRSAQWENVCGGWLASIDPSNLCMFARKEEKNIEKAKSFLSLHETRCLISSKAIDKLCPALHTQGDEFSWTRSWRNDVRWLLLCVLLDSFFFYLFVRPQLCSWRLGKAHF